MKFETLSDLLKSPLRVEDSRGNPEDLELKPSAEARLYFVDEGPPLPENVPIADVKLSDGGGATLRFDTWPPRFNEGVFDVLGFGRSASKEEFIRRVNSLLAKR
jgi:hypothetical protein